VTGLQQCNANAEIPLKLTYYAANSTLGLKSHYKGTEIGDALEQSLTVLTALHTLGLRGMSHSFFVVVIF
jgi:hypothetical protein